MWTGYKCREKVLHKGEEGIIVGKRYGHATDIYCGRVYDIKVVRGTYETIIPDVSENMIKSIVPDDEFTWTTSGHGAAMKIYHPRSVLVRDKK